MSHIQSDYSQRATFRFGLFDNVLNKKAKLDAHETVSQQTDTTTRITFFQQSPKKRLEQLMLDAELALSRGDYHHRDILLERIFKLIMSSPHLIDYTVKVKNLSLNPIEFAIRHKCYSIANELVSLGKALGFKETYLIKDKALRDDYRAQLSLNQKPKSAP